ncbi:MAG: tetratricopeptide repeat protein [Deltaproteobacteria bacterium]|nr:tetratricopeptide repeat protein [Deltaproteobacteria bacterium]
MNIYHLPAGDPAWARAYGFSPQPLTAIESKLAEATAAGQVVGWWRDGLTLHCDPAHSRARRTRWTGDTPLAAEYRVDAVPSYWEALEYFCEGELDALIVGQSWISFPAAGREVLARFAAHVPSAADNDATTATPLTLPDCSNEVAGDPFLLNQWGKMLSYAQRYTEAGAAFRQALELNPEYGEPYGNLATLLWNFGKRREAFALFTEALLKNPHRTTTQLNFFDAGHNMEEFATIAAVMEELIPSVPDQTEFRHHLAIAYHKLGRASDALTALREILAHDPHDAEAQALLEGFEAAPSAAASQALS